MCLQPNCFLCHYCSFKTSVLRQYVHHQRYHRNIRRLLICGYKGCSIGLRSEACFRSHLIRSHKVLSREVATDATSTLYHSTPRGTYICRDLLCAKEFDSYRSLIQHVKYHIKNCQRVPCPITNCNKRFNDVNCFTGHLSKKHRNVWKMQDKGCNETVNTDDTESGNSEVYPCTSEENDLPNSNESDELDPFLASMAQFLMKLEYQYLIPQSTIQYIVSELKNVMEEDHTIIKKKLQRKLIEHGVESSKINNIIHDTLEFGSVESAYTTLNTCYKRKEFYKKNFSFVQPEKKEFVDEDGKQKFFYYIPICETVKALFSDKSISLDIKTPTANETDWDGVYRDFTDGFVFQQNEFFRQNPNALQLILYQDAFEVVVPIGPARKKHKLTGVYLSIGNLPDHVRSHINSIQLVALCYDKDFNNEKIMRPIVDDLKVLEEHGVQVPGQGTVKGSLVFVVGDNLGSHILGGFIANFSKSRHFCRYCCVDRQQFEMPGGENLQFPLRTVQSYNDAVSCLRPGQSILGIKFNSILNELKYYHVCSPGLPPCLAHDLFEGVVCHDLMLFVKYFIAKGWISLDTLNKCIERFPYSSKDKQDKPIAVEENSDKIKGGAMQVAAFLRLFPLIMSQYIRDIHDEVWLTLLNLVEIVEMVMAPAIHKTFIPYLQILCEEYVSARRNLFPNYPLRPKHHYISKHYSELILAFGPLMKVFTLRFESKHTFFKRSIRSSKNFINIMYSLSMRHELFQCFLRTGSNFRAPIDTVGLTPFEICRYAEGLQLAIRRSCLKPDELQECISVILKGTVYQKGTVVVLRQAGPQYKVEMGRVCLILIDNSWTVHFLIELLEVTFCPHLRSYQLHKSVGYECIAANKLLSKEALHIYVLGTTQYVKLKYGLVSVDF